MKVGRPKGTTKENKRLTEISIYFAKNRITAIIYHKKTGLHSKNFPVGLLQNIIDEVAKKHHLPNNHKITKTLISQIIVTAKHDVPYGQVNVFRLCC